MVSTACNIYMGFDQSVLVCRLSAVRPTSYDPYLIRLEEEKKVLDRRLDILVMVLMLPKNAMERKDSYWKRLFNWSKRKNSTPYHLESESLQKHSCTELAVDK